MILSLRNILAKKKTESFLKRKRREIFIWTTSTDSRLRTTRLKVNTTFLTLLIKKLYPIETLGITNVDLGDETDILKVTKKSLKEDFQKDIEKLKQQKLNKAAKLADDDEDDDEDYEDDGDDLLDDAEGIENDDDEGYDEE